MPLSPVVTLDERDCCYDPASGSNYVNFVDPTGRAAQLSSDNAGYVIGKSPGVDFEVMYDGGFSGKDYIRIGNAYFSTPEQAEEYLVRRWTNNFETEVKGGVTGLRNSPLFMAALVRVSVAQAFDFRERPGDSTLNALSFAVGGRGGPVRGPVITKPGPTGFVLVGNPKPVVVSKPTVVAPKHLSPIQITKAKFGHTFQKHGQGATEFLTNRAKNSGNPVGQFTDDQAAARFIQDNLNKVQNGAVSLPVPKNFPARIINPDGSFSIPQSIRLVPGGKGVKTAYPDILPPGS